MPPANRSRISETQILVPLMHGLPPHTGGSMLIRSSRLGIGDTFGSHIMGCRRCRYNNVQSQRLLRVASGSIVEHRDGADWRAGAFAPFQRQADELELAFSEQAFQIAQAFHMGD